MFGNSFGWRTALYTTLLNGGNEVFVSLNENGAMPMPWCCIVQAGVLLE